MEKGDLFAGASIIQLLYNYAILSDFDEIKSVGSIFILLNNMVKLSLNWPIDDKQVLTTFWEKNYNLFTVRIYSY